MPRQLAKEISRTMQSNDNPTEAARKAKYNRLRDAGYTSKEANRFKGRSWKTIEDLLNTKATPLPKSQLDQFEKIRHEKSKLWEHEAREAKKIASWSKGKILVFYQDLIGFTDASTVKEHRKIFSHMKSDGLAQSLKGLSELNFGESPASDHKILITNDPTAITQMKSEGYQLIYEGTGQNYQALLVAANTMMILLYDTATKDKFLYDLIQAVRTFSPRNAQRLMNDVL